MGDVLLPGRYVNEEERAAWLRERQHGIGGSDAAVILGHSRFKSPFDLYLEKTGDVVDLAPSRMLARGRVLEDVAAELFAANMGRTVARHPMAWARETFWPEVFHEGEPFAFCNVDRLIHATPEERTALLEIKSVWPSALASWRLRGAPPDAIIQVQHNMAVKGYDEAWLMPFSADAWDWLFVKVERDDVFIRDVLTPALRTFWLDHVLPEVAPEDRGDMASDVVPESPGEAVTRDDPAFSRAAAQLQEARELRDEGKQLYDIARDRMAEVVGDARVTIGPAREGWEAVVHKIPNPGRRSFDRSALENTRPLDPIKAAAVVLEELEPISSAEAATAIADKVVKASRLDLEGFEKRGRAYTELRPYFRRNEGGS